jgi:hypothetical protein
MQKIGWQGCRSVGQWLVSLVLVLFAGIPSVQAQTVEELHDQIVLLREIVGYLEGQIVKNGYFMPYSPMEPCFGTHPACPAESTEDMAYILALLQNYLNLIAALQRSLELGPRGVSGPVAVVYTGGYTQGYFANGWHNDGNWCAMANPQIKLQNKHYMEGEPGAYAFALVFDFAHCPVASGGVSLHSSEGGQELNPATNILRFKMKGDLPVQRDLMVSLYGPGGSYLGTVHVLATDNNSYPKYASPATADYYWREVTIPFSAFGILPSTEVTITSIDFESSVEGHVELDAIKFAETYTEIVFQTEPEPEENNGTPFGTIWSNSGSWSVTTQEKDFAGCFPTDTSTDMLSAQFTRQDGWAGLVFTDHTGTSTEWASVVHLAFRGLSFDTIGNDKVWVVMYGPGYEFYGQQPIRKYMGMPNPGGCVWMEIRIPLADLGTQGKQLSHIAILHEGLGSMDIRSVRIE